jgi:hypothetical protein
MSKALLWISKGKKHGLHDLVSWAGKTPEQPFEEVAARITTIVLGPHASAAFPDEIQPFISPTLTLRKQHDFSDVITAATGRAWAAADPRVVFVETPHSRVVLDANRTHAADIGPALRECFARLKRQRAGEDGVTFKGVDCVRPVTFSGEDVLIEPSDEARTHTRTPTHKHTNTKTQKTQKTQTHTRTRTCEHAHTQAGWMALIAAIKVSAPNGYHAYQTATAVVIAAVRAAQTAGTPLTIIGL